MKKLVTLLALFFIQLLSADNPLNTEKELLSNLSLREKIGQLCMVAAVANEEQDSEIINAWAKWQPLYNIKTAHIESLIKEHKIGGVVFFGQYTHPKNQLSLTKHFQSLSKIPLLIALDAECGLGSRLDNKSVLRFPYNMTLGAVQDINLIYRVGYEIGQELKTIGAHVNFAPVVDINNNPKNPVIGMRSFGSDKERVAKLGIAYMQGLQDAGIYACAKHFPGHGDTSTDSHEELPLIPHSLKYLEANELYPFKKLIEAGIKAVMIAHLEVPALEKEDGLPSSLSRSIVTDLLKIKMGFDGLIFTDALGMKGVSDHFEIGEVELKALQAGADLLVCPLDVVKAIDYIEKAVKSGEITEEEINIKVLKVLQAKKWALQNAINTDPNRLESLTSGAAKNLKRLLFSKAVTIVKPQGGPLKFVPEETVVINTDGELVQFEETMKTLSSFQFIKQFPDQESKDYNEIIHKADNVIISISKSSIDKEGYIKITQEAIQQLKASGKKVTVILFCSPYHISHFNQADGIIVAYEGDSDAQLAAAEIICGVRKAEGVLPIEVQEQTMSQ